MTHPDAPSGQPYAPPPWDPNRLPPPSPPVLKTPREWEQIKGIRVADPDGWRSFSQLGPKDFGEPLTEEEFDRRVATSTVDHRPPPGGDGGSGKKKRRKWPWILGGVFALIVAAGVAAGNTADTAPKVALPTATPAPYPTLPPEQKAANAKASTAVKAPPAPTAAAPTQPKPAAPPLTTAQAQAIGAAKDYLAFDHFSRTGLIRQLEFDKYTRADATYAVDHLTVNWNEQAAGAAKDYLSFDHFSRAGLIEQLMFDGFTRAQAVYAAGKVGL